jgi:hypothetical protein
MPNDTQNSPRQRSTQAEISPKITENPNDSNPSDENKSAVNTQTAVSNIQGNFTVGNINQSVTNNLKREYNTYSQTEQYFFKREEMSQFDSSCFPEFRL